jgi:hypothetical protein
MAGEVPQAGASGEAGAAGETFGTRFPCGDATVVGLPESGLESCSGGYLRRVGPALCFDNVPRTSAIPDYNPDVDECEFDSDCSEDTYGPYAHCGVRTGGSARTCVAGCTVDADCDAGDVCLCEEPIGRCVPAGCTSGEDCASGFDCASYSSSPGCFSTAFACQTDGDACVSSAECSDFSPNPSFCILSGATRVCSINQCTTQ